jgi:hypothetical protein
MGESVESTLSYDRLPVMTNQKGSLGGPTATRTRDLLIKSQLLYQLSYRPKRERV